ncbi:hypothetical protein ABMA28_006668 [Loxostege sticticalis]|uniref:Uncharacterized protein n=1 Tax=Loxostege sticticalis TaxID=481309 RepID=A0ABD0TN19_LOXSC
MPKRKHDVEDKVTKKIRRLEKKLKKCKRRRGRIISSSSEDSTQSHHNQNGMYLHFILLSDKRQTNNVTLSPLLPTPSSSNSAQQQPVPSTSQEEPAVLVEEDGLQPLEGLPEESRLDDDILEILGDDPTTTVEYGKNIRQELAARFNHIATNGMNKENRKELCEKYLIPENCKLIGAPALNAEVKAALNETTLKRDKLIESRQKRIAAAISCLGEALSHALESKNKDNAQIKRLMDAARLICDSQHNDSISRRNLAVYSLKKEMKEPLLNTKIDTSLFGEHLTDSLKVAKAVTKSSSELKSQFKPPPSKNWKAPVAGRRPPATTRRAPPAAPMTSAQSALRPPPPPQPTAEPRNTRAPSSRRPPQPPPRSARRRY